MDTADTKNKLQNLLTSNRWIAILWIPLFWILVCAAFYWEVINVQATHIVGGNDLNNMFRIWLDYARFRISEGHLPLWNPYLFSGQAFISDPQPALFYPPTWLSLLINPTQGLSWSLVLHICWAAIGSTLWLRSIQDQNGHPIMWIGAIAGGAVYAFNGHTYARIQAGHLGVITTSSWLPWVLWAINILSQKPTWRIVGRGAICIGLALLAGHTATFVYLVILICVYTLMLTWTLQKEVRKKFLFMVVLMGLLGILLSSIQLLPTLQNILNSTRLSETDYTFASRFSWPVGYLITLFIPNFFGEPVRTGYWGDGIYDEMIFYVGLLPLMLIWVTSHIPNDKKYRTRISFWLVVAAASLFAAFGRYSIIHRLLFRFVPLFSSMRAPARAGFLFTVSVAALTALAINFLSHSDISNRRFLKDNITPGRIMIVLGLAIFLVMGAYMLFAWGKDSNPEAGRFWHLANAVAVFGLFFAISSGWLHQWSKSNPSEHLNKVALVIILLDLWTLGSGLVQVVPAPLNGYWNIVAQNTTTDSGRVLPWGLNIFDQNGALSYKVKSVFGYNPVEDAEYHRYITYNPDPRAKIYDLLNVTHVSTTVPLTLEEDDSLQLMTEDRGVYIYNRTTALPQVWIPENINIIDENNIIPRINDYAFNPLKTALIEPGVYCPHNNNGMVRLSISTKPEEIEALVEGKGGIVVLSERYTPGWHATIDGVKTQIYKAYGILQAICVPPGKHQIRLHYLPLVFIVGACISAVSFVVCCILSIAKRKKQSIN